MEDAPEDHDEFLMENFIFCVVIAAIITAWKVCKYGVTSGPYLDTFHAVYW